MTLPLQFIFKGKAYPTTPAVPTDAPDGFITPKQLEPTKNDPPFGSGELESLRGRVIELILQKIVLALRGVFLPSNGSGFKQLTDWVAELQVKFAERPVIGSLLEIITGEEDGDLNDLGTWFNNLRTSIFDGINFRDSGFTVAGALDNIIDNLLPRGRLAELLSGKLKPGQEPQTLLDTWDRLHDIVVGDGTANVGLPGFGVAAAILQRLAADANDTAQTGINLINFGASQPIWGHTNPTMQVPLGRGHLRKFTASGSTVSTATDPESITVTPTQSAGIFNRFDRSRDVDVLTWRGKGNTGVTAMMVHIWRMDAPVVGTLTWLQSISVVPASLPTAAFDTVYVPLSSPIHVDQGTVLGAEVTTTGGNHQIAGIDVPWNTDDLTARPKRPGFSRSVNAGATPPATIADASVSYSTREPAIAMGQVLSALPAPKYVYTESFSGSTAGWRALTGGLLFSSGKFCTSASSNNFALFNYVTYSDDARVEFDLSASWGVLNPSFNNGDKIRLAMCCSSSASQYVAIEIESNRSTFSPGADHSLRIVTGTSPTATPTIRASRSLDGDYTGRLSLEYRTNTNTFTLFIGASAALTWTDVGHVIAHGPDLRQAAIYANFGASGQVVCDNFTYKDV